MAKSIVEKLLSEAEKTMGSYACIEVLGDGITFTSDCGTRRSTRKISLVKDKLKEAENQLKSFDERTLLFFRNIKTLEVSLQDGRRSKFVSEPVDEFIVRISSKKITEMNPKISHWFRIFQDNKGIAYLLRCNKDEYSVIACQGNLFIDSFKTDYDGDLCFCINGDFSLNKELVLEETNQTEIERIADLFVKSISQLMYHHVLNDAIPLIMPSTMDLDDLLHRELVGKGKEFCNQFPVFKTRDNTYVSKKQIIVGAEEVVDLFPQETIDKYFNLDLRWMVPYEKGNREEYFFVDNNIAIFNREFFLQWIFSEDLFNELSELIVDQNDKWLRQFYLFCALPLEDNIKKIVVSGLINLPCMRDQKNNMKYPLDIMISEDDNEITKNSSIVKKSIIGNKDNEDTRIIIRFLESDLGIKRFSKKPEIEQLLIYMQEKKPPVDRNYCEKLLAIADFDEKYPGEIECAQYEIFPYESKRGVSRTSADRLVIGKPYVKEGLLLSKALGRDQLWKGFKKLCSDEEIQLIVEFAERCGAIGYPKIHMQVADKHINFQKELLSHGNIGTRDTSFDYIIPGIEMLLRRRSIQINNLIWKAIIDCDYSTAKNVLIAEYSSGGRKTVKRTESSLLQILKNRTWVPDNSNKLYMPKDIAVEEINKDFLYDAKNPILKALKFGSGDKERREKRIELERFAKTENMVLIDQDEYKAYLKWKKEHQN